MTATETTTRNDGGAAAAGVLRGCALCLIATPSPGGVGYVLSLDRSPATYCRGLTPAEVAALARLNPDDGVPEAALLPICDVTVALAALCGTGAVITRGNGRSFVEFAPVSRAEMAELGCVAGALIAAMIAGGQPCDD